MLQNFLKIYPKRMSAQMSQGVLFVKLDYAVEQYGVLTGPFEMVVHYQPEHLAQDSARWVIASNTKHRDDSAFESLFKTLEMYLKDQVAVNPLDEVLSGVKKSFEMYFPEMHCDFFKKPCDKDNRTPQRACAHRAGGAGLKSAVSSFLRPSGRQQAAGMGWMH